MTKTVLSLLCGLFALVNLHALDLSTYPKVTLSAEDATLVWVDQQFTGTSTGAQDAPYATIGDAVAVATADSVIVVRKGLYREAVSLRGANAPSALIAYPGEEVLLTGMQAVTDWEMVSKGIYTAMVDTQPEHFYLGANPLTLGRIPADGWIRGELKGELTLSNPELSALTFPLEETQAYIWAQSGNVFFTAKVESHDGADISFISPSKWMKLTNDDKFYLQNNRTFLQKPGTWAWEKVDERFRIICHVENPEWLKLAQMPGAHDSVLRLNDVSGTSVLGLTVTGGVTFGIHVTRSENITVRHCKSYDNGSYGIYLRDVTASKANNNLVLFNGNTGIVYHTVSGSEISENEVAYNGVDGVVVCWDSHDNTIARNYVHHQLLWGHPDGMQIFRGVSKLRFHNNLILAVGQTLMCEQATEVEFIGNVCVGSMANMLICGHGDARDFTVKNNTFMFPGYSAINMTADTYRVNNNAFVLGHTGSAFYVPESAKYTGDQNLFWVGPGLEGNNFIRTSNGSFSDIASLSTSSGQDLASVNAAPQFRNAPVLFDIIDEKRIPDCTKETFYLRYKGVGMKKGDIIEINSDGIERRVTDMDDGTITVSPALQMRPTKAWLISNWKNKRDFQLDLSPDRGSPLLNDKGTQYIGGTLSVPGFQKGDFNGDGVRDCPAVPAFFDARLVSYR